MRYHRLTVKRRATIVPTLAVCMIFVFTLLAFSVDVGLMALARTHCQNAADAGAMASVRVLNGDVATQNNIAGAPDAAKAAGIANKILNTPIPDTGVTTEVGYYGYNTTLQKFEAIFTGTKPASESWTATRVTINGSQPMFFAKVLGYSSFPTGATATAVHRPRDVALVLDFSGSMKFSSETHYPSNGTITGSLNPDPNFPKFGHWSVASFQSRMQRTTIYVDGGGEAHAANNMTMETENGLPIVKDFLTRDSGGILINAFHRPSSPYTPMTWACPAPDDWTTQANGTEEYWNASGTGKGGDPWPRFRTTGPNFASLTNGEYARTAQELLTGSNSGFSNSDVRSTVTFATAQGGGGGQFDPEDSNNPKGTEGYGPNFKGYSIGPGYYGKTFYIWPPDPRFHPSANTTSPETGSNPKAKDTNGRWMADWRKRFFLKPDGTAFDGDNTRLWDTSTEQWRQAGSSYLVNYNAIVAWIKSGPQVLPDNLRAGRVLYYSAIPTTIPATGGTQDQRFWRSYINYVIGNGDDDMQRQTLYGRHPDDDDSFGTSRITEQALLTGDPRPYMRYNDNPVRPRLNFWFGPLTMLCFLNDNNYGTYGRNWMPGTCHESQCWQLKAGVSSALDDIKKNHPNDWVSLSYFSSLPGYTTNRVALGKDYTRMKNTLFFPFSLLDSLADLNAEVRPYDANYSNTAQAEVPNANGGTCPESGFMLAYNQLSSRVGYNGRRGAAKVVILETDGVPNTPANGTFTRGTPAPYNSHYTSLGIGPFIENGDPGVIADAKAVASRIVALDTATNPGYSTARVPARIHVIAFGDLFQTNSPAKTQALQFLLDVQKIGGTSPQDAVSLDSYKIITGAYDVRIENLRQAFERIMQSGVQVSLIR